jgi:flagellar biogenesis protein FliO
MIDIGTILHAFAMLGVTVGLIIGLGWVLRTYGGKLGLHAAANPQTLRITNRLPLTPHTTVYEIQTPTHTHLVAASNTHTTVLHSVPVTPTHTSAVKKPRT